MKFEEYLIGLLVFILVATISIAWINDTNTRYAHYGTNISTRLFGSAITNGTALETIGTGADDQVLGSSSTDDPQVTMTKSSYGVMKLLRNSYTMVNDILNSISSVLHIPPIVTKVAMLAIVITIVFTVIYLIFGKWSGSL